MKIRNMFAGLMAMVVAVTAVAPRRAQAVAGIATGMIPVAVVGGALVAAAGGLAIAGVVMDKKNCPSIACGVTSVVMGLVVALPLGIIGLIMLDEPGQNVVFTQISAADASALQISEETAEIYNSETEELNAARETVMANVDPRSPQVQEQIVTEWTSVLKAFTPATHQVLKAMAERAQREAK